ncbi:MAG TPA: hypothetical protein VG015_01435 [Candidatus Dormibacteraeota bacterium]|nr:hypothetical protein [Candidatus Dormibacteraeota bacterium]
MGRHPNHGRQPVVVYAVGLVGLALRQVLPLTVSTLGLLAATIGIAWLSIALWPQAGQASPGSGH